MRLTAWCGCVGLSCLLLAFLAAPARAQDRDTLSTARTGSAAELGALPLDALDQFLLLLPGVADDGAGGLVVRGFAGQPVSLFEGVPVRPLYNGAEAGFRDAWRGSRLSYGLRRDGGVSLTTGLTGVLVPDAAQGILAPDAPTVSSRFGASATWDTDEWRGLSGQGYNAIRGVAGGTIGGRLELSLVGSLTGARSQAPVPGGTGAPIYLPSGIDTIVGVPSAIFDPFADTSHVAIQRMVIARGDCDEHSGSGNAGIADNYGFECSARLPSTARSSWDLEARARYALGDRTHLVLGGATSQLQGRRFIYEDVSVPVQPGAARSWSGVLMLGAEHGFDTGTLGPVTLRGWASRQGDEGERGPLTTEAEAGSQDPTLGFMVGALDFQFGLDDFPVNDELVDNYRRNTPGSRRSPYDLENTGQYALVDAWRNNAYGVLGFADFGGPVGPLALYDETRTVLGVEAEARPGRHQLGLRLDWTGADVANYAHQLTSQARSDVWITSPSRLGVAGAARFDLSSFVLELGARYDQYATGAERPWLRDTIASSASFGEFIPFPRLSSYGYDGTDWNPDLVEFREDESHGALSPSLRLFHRLTPAVTIRAGAERMARMPDLSLSMAGVNTDLGIVTTLYPYGTDLGPEHVATIEGGVTWGAGEWVVDGAVAWRQETDGVVARLNSLFDPLLRRNVDLVQYVNGTADRRALVIEAQVQRQFGAWVTGRASYTFTDATTSAGDDLEYAPSGTRPHDLAVAVVGAVPEGWQRGSILGSVFSGVRLATVLQSQSGLPYTDCPATIANAFVLSGQPCVGLSGEPNGQRLPSVTLVDLRLEKAFAVGGHTVAGYLDVRNLFNSEVVERLFASTNSTTNDLAEADAWRRDSLDYRREAGQSGVSRPDGGMDLRFGGLGAGGCGNWLSAANAPASPNCVYLIRAEERFGDGDGIFSVSEQQRASTAYYRSSFGRQAFLGAGRMARLGVRVSL